MNDDEADDSDPRERERRDDLFAIDKALNRLLMDGFIGQGTFDEVWDRLHGESA